MSPVKNDTHTHTLTLAYKYTYLSHCSFFDKDQKTLIKETYQYIKIIVDYVYVFVYVYVLGEMLFLTESVSYQEKDAYTVSPQLLIGRQPYLFRSPGSSNTVHGYHPHHLQFLNEIQYSSGVALNHFLEIILQIPSGLNL